MFLKNFECKAVASNLVEQERKLLQLNPMYIGEDHQVDTYFNVPKGRLKLREGNIENALIYYERNDVADSKTSSVLLYQYQPDNTLKEILTTTLGIKAVVNKQRKIYFIDNVKFHFDTVKGLGTFIEIEAIDKNGDMDLGKLKSQCEFYITLFNLNKADFIAHSYSDMLVNMK